MIKVEGLTKRYARTVAVDNISFEVEKGGIVGFLGPNGAGKTTTMRVLTCFLPPSSGSANVAGFDVLENPLEVKKRIGYLPESPPLYPEMEVHEYLTFVGRLKGIAGSDIAKRVDPELPKLFAELPRSPYGIRPIPPYQGEGTAEYYSPGAADGSRSGWFNANIVALKTRPKWEMEALFLHEAVPGHHLQTARALELGTLPNFRRNAWYVAYGEGWALYAEGLGDRLGLYTAPESRFGQLRMEIWRAARLVVDTGIHALGWTRQQAIDWMTERTGVSRDDVTAEVDRYYAWPGQALGYKIGQLKIIALRDKAHAALGERFDIRRFHMVVLDHGAVPLPVLETLVDEWIAREKAAAKG